MNCRKFTKQDRDKKVQMLAARFGKRRTLRKYLTFELAPLSIGVCCIPPHSTSRQSEQNHRSVKYQRCDQNKRESFSLADSSVVLQAAAARESQHAKEEPPVEILCTGQQCATVIRREFADRTRASLRSEAHCLEFTFHDAAFHYENPGLVVSEAQAPGDCTRSS